MLSYDDLAPRFVTECVFCKETMLKGEAMAEYIDKYAFVAWLEKQKRLSKLYTIMMLEQTPAADVIPTPLKYAAMTNIHDGEEYTLDLSIPITKKQFDAIANGTDIWEVLKNG